MHGVTARFRWHSTCLILLACQRMLTDAMVLRRLLKTARLTHMKRQDSWRGQTCRPCHLGFPRLPKQLRFTIHVLTNA